MTIRVMCYGLGPIGVGIARVALQRSNVQLVGAIDIDPHKQGHDVGELLGGAPLNVLVSGNASIIKTIKPDIVLHATGSSLAQVAPQLYALLDAGINVVSTCEELAFPWTVQPQLAAELDAAARRAGVTLLGTGVNPGYAMDALPLFLTAPCTNVSAVRVLRIVNAANRRGPLQHKIGAGLTPEAFADQVKAGTVRHVGLPESLHMLATSFGWNLDRSENTIKPVLADSLIETDFVTVQPGQVAGVWQVACGFIGEREVLRLDLRMYLGAPDAQDTIEVEGDPPVRMTIPGGLHGDSATAAMIVNAIPSVIRAEAGLSSMSDLPLVHYW